MSKRFVQVGLGVLLGLVATAVIFSFPGSRDAGSDAPHAIEPPLPLPRADASLVDTRGEAAPVVPPGDTAHLVFFGYTHCPDVCPLTMGALREVGDRIQAEGLPRPGVTMVTVDPARDTPERLAGWLERFGEHVRGLTGTEEDVRSVATAWGVYIGPLPGAHDDGPAAEGTSPDGGTRSGTVGADDGGAEDESGGGTQGTTHGDMARDGSHGDHEGYVVDHTGRTFVVRDGAIVASFAPGTGPDAMTTTLLRLLGDR